MSIKLTQLQCKEVICIGTGQRLGFIADVQVELPEGTICAIIVPGPGKLMGLGNSIHDYCIPWSSIRKIGPDIVLVEANPEECRIIRQKPHRKL